MGKLKRKLCDSMEFNFTEPIQDSKGRIIDLTRVKTLEDLKNAIILEIEFPYCKNCGFSPKCPEYEKSRGDNCGLLEDVIRRYIDMNIKSIDYKNEHTLIEFIWSCYYFAHTSKDFLDLISKEICEL